MNGWQLLRKTCLDLLFPPHCLLCNTILQQGGESFCPNCLMQIEYLRPPFCRCCGMMLAGGSERRHLCGACLRHPPAYTTAMACIPYDQPAAGLLHRLKYNRDTTVLPGLAKIIRVSGRVVLPCPDLVVPVPLHHRRLKERGLNQSVLLARLFFPTRSDDIRPDILRRIRDTPAQANLDGAARRKNLRSAFIVTDAEAVQGRSVCLIDDVFTTGATASECSKTLLKHGVKEVRVLTLARVERTR